MADKKTQPAGEARKVMLTGVTGFVGSHTAKALQDAGHTVRALVRTPDKLQSVTARVGVDIDALEVTQGDITDTSAVREALQGCDAAVHAAAVVGTDPTTEAAIEATNFAGALNVLGAAVDAGCDPVVHVSTSSALFPFRSDPVTGDHPVGTHQGAYSRSKAQCEQLARSYQDQGKPVVIVYPAMITGPDDHGESTQVSPMKFWVTKPYPVCDGYTLSLVDVRDVAAVIAASVRPGRGSKRYVLFGHHVTSKEHHKLLCEATGRDLRAVKVPKAVFWAWGHFGDLTRRFGRDVLLTSEGYEYMFNFCAGDNSFTEADTGVTLRPLADSTLDTLAWMHEAGHLTSEEAGTAATVS